MIIKNIHYLYKTAPEKLGPWAFALITWVEIGADISLGPRDVSAHAFHNVVSEPRTLGPRRALGASPSIRVPSVIGRRGKRLTLRLAGRGSASWSNPSSTESIAARTPHSFVSASQELIEIVRAATDHIPLHASRCDLVLCALGVSSAKSASRHQV